MPHAQIDWCLDTALGHFRIWQVPQSNASCIVDYRGWGFFFVRLFIKMWNGALKLARGATFLLLIRFVSLRNLSHGADFLVVLPASFDAVKFL